MFIQSLILSLKYLGPRNPQARPLPVELLKAALTKSGYHTFDVDKSRQLPIHFDNMVAVHPDDVVSSVVWIYQKPDGVFIVRPFVDSAALNRLSERLSDKNLEGIVLKQVKNLILREAEDSWLSWLSEASKEKARELGYL